MKKVLKLGLSAIGPIAMIIILTMPIGPLAGGLGILQPVGGIFDTGHAIDMSGNQTIKISELDSQVQVIMDEWAIPHIYAETKEDAFITLGYLHAKDRLFQMVMQKYLAAGRISEIMGGESWAISSDKYYRTIGLARSAQMTYEGLLAEVDTNPDAEYVLDVIEAYVFGINTYLTRMSDAEVPFELKVVGFIPEPWEPVDIFAWSKMMSWGLSGSLSRELAYHEINQAFNNDTLFEDMFPDVWPYSVPIIPEQYNLSLVEYPNAPGGWTAGEPVSSQNTAEIPILDSQKTQSLLSIVSEVIQPFGNLDYVGSNNWVVNGSKSSTGRPILANDPHLRLQLPSLWYEAHIVVPGLLNVQGGTLAGTPAVLIGHNEHIAWGLTNVGLDVLDLFVEEVNTENQDQYWYNNEWKDFEIINEDILLRSGEIVEYEVKWSIHGPCIDSITESYDVSNDGIVNLAMNWTGSGFTHEILAVSKLNKANNMTDYFDSLYWWDAAPQNFVYADDEGNIALTVAGRFPIRSGYSGKYPVVALNDSVGWTGSIPYAHLPRSVNPTQGYLQSANQLSIDPESYAYPLVGIQAPGYRGRRIDSLLSSDSSVTVEDMMRHQADDLDLSAQNILPLVLDAWDNSAFSNSSIQSMVTEMKNWNYRMDPDSIAPTIWMYLDDSLTNEIFDEVTSTGVSRGNIYTPILERVIKENESYYIDDKSTTDIESLEEIVVRAFQRCYNLLVSDLGENQDNWEYGLYHIIYVDHLASFTYLGGGPHHGSGYTLNAAFGWTVTGGPSRRMVVSFEDILDIYTVYPGGQSGNLVSEHWSDLFALWYEYDDETEHYGYTHERFYASFATFPTNHVKQFLTFNP
ncbi:MAG: hypothetical protein GF411_09225 [Candidatus Lokiarchaeota archaeon]|nr:hypothetical protein [Candidatus Lokiarchaeota archaeon]